MPLLTCRQITDTASDYLEGPVTLTRRLSLSMHLLMCKHCRRYFRQLELTRGVAARATQSSEPTDAEIETLVGRLRNQDI